MKSLLLLLALFLISCQKPKSDKPAYDGINCSGSCFILKGKVTDKGINAPIASAEIKFFLAQRGNFIGAPDDVYLVRAITDNNGEYEVRFDGSNYKYQNLFYAEIKKDGYIYAPKGETRLSYFLLDSSNLNIPFTTNIPLFKPTVLKVRLRATTITNFNTFVFSYSFGTQYGNRFEVKGQRMIDTTVSLITAGDVSTFLSYSVYGNGIDIHKKDTLVAIRNIETLYQINL